MTIVSKCLSFTAPADRDWETMVEMVTELAPKMVEVEAEALVVLEVMLL